MNTPIDGRVYADDPDRVVWARADRDVVLFRGQDVVGWQGKAANRGSTPADRRLEFWRRCVGWQHDSMDEAGEYRLVAEGSSSLRLVGEAPPPTVGEVRWERGRVAEVPLREPGLRSTGARLFASPRGTVLCDPAVGLVWCLEDGVAWRLSGVDGSHGLRAWRGAGGVWISSSWTSRQGALGLLLDDGRVVGRQLTSGPPAVFFELQRRTWAFASPGLSGDAVLCELTPDGQRHPGRPVPDACEDAHARGDTVYWVSRGRLGVLARRDDAWVEQPDLLVPRGDLERFNPAPELRGPEVTWEGPAGAFEAQIPLVNVGRDHVGLVVTIEREGSASVTSVGVDSLVVTEDQGTFDLGSLALPSQGTVNLVLCGRVSTASTLRLSFAGRETRHGGGFGEDATTERVAFPMGRARLQLDPAVRELQLLRGSEQLRFDPAWLDLLRRRDALDLERPAPDLQRWLDRALRRCRVSSVDEDPDAVHAMWLRFTERERTEHAGKVPSYKLESPGHWVITPEEARGLRSALPDDHPLAAFARDGFVVVRGT